MESEYKLTEGALQIIMNGGDIANPIMQILGNKKIVGNNSNAERYRLVLSDGKHTISHAMISNQVIKGTDGVPENFSIVKLKRYITNVVTTNEKANTRIVLILDMELLISGKQIAEKLGDPVQLTADLLNSQNIECSNNVFSTSCSLSNTQVISPIDSLNPFHNNWVIKARVSRKSDIRTWSNSNGEGKLFSVDLIDDSGEIRCTGFKELVDKFFYLFEEDKVYFVSKCQLKHANKDYCYLNHDYEMTFTPASLVEECKDENGVPQIKYNFVSFDKINEMETGSVVDTIGVCKEVRKPQKINYLEREILKRDVILIDQSKNAIFLTMWGSQAENFDASDNAIVLVKNAKIKEFSGLKNLTTTGRSQIKINPKIPETFQLKSWYKTEGHLVDVSTMEERGSPANLKVPWMTFKQVQELDFHSLDKAVYYQTMATVFYIRGDHPVYKACPVLKCKKKITDMENGMYRCDKCNREYPNFNYGLYFSMNLKDSSSNQWVSIFGSEAEKILDKTSEEVGVAVENDSDYVKSFFEDATFKQFVFKCRAKMEFYNDEETLRTVVIKADPVDYEEYDSHLVNKIETFVSK